MSIPDPMQQNASSEGTPSVCSTGCSATASSADNASAPVASSQAADSAVAPKPAPRRRGRPPLGGTNRKRINLSFDGEAIRLFRAAADSQDISISLWLERVGRRFLSSNGN